MTSKKTGSAPARGSYRAEKEVVLGANRNAAGIARTQSTDTIAAALEYAETGWPVFPVSPDKKTPCKSAKFSNGKPWGMTCDAKEIRRDFEKWPTAMIGVPTGKPSGFWVLDIDTVQGHAKNGIAALEELKARHGALPDTLMATTPSGGKHLYFRTNGVSVLNSTSTLGVGIDVRGDGGMVIVPPSRRASGQYKWANNHPISDPPRWLLALVTRGDGPRVSSARNADPVT